MGIILLPGFLFHLAIFVLGFVFLGKKSKSMIDFMKYSTIPVILSSLSGYIFINYIFSINENKKIWAFDILTELTYGKHLLILLLPALLAIYIHIKKDKILFGSILYSFQMVPFSSIVMYFIFSSEYFKYYNISLTY